MKVLVIKTSSLGDILHTLPAVQDAISCIDKIEFDWLVEEQFTDIPAWNPNISQVIAVANRRWRKLGDCNPLPEISQFLRDLRKNKYDVIIDAQGLLKSAMLAFFTKGIVHGFDGDSAREPLVGLAYQHRHHVNKDRHAISRNRELFSKVLGYPIPGEEIGYGIDQTNLGTWNTNQPYMLALHGTTWASKRWPGEYWHSLIEIAGQHGLNVLLPWGNENERVFAERLSRIGSHAVLLPRLDLNTIAACIAKAKAVVATDTGLGHLAAALSIPCVSLYGSTNADKTGTRGHKQIRLYSSLACSPCLKRNCPLPDQEGVFPTCYAPQTPDIVWDKVSRLLAKQDDSPTIS